MASTNVPHIIIIVIITISVKQILRKPVHLKLYTALAVISRSVH